MGPEWRSLTGRHSQFDDSQTLAPSGRVSTERKTPTRTVSDPGVITRKFTYLLVSLFVY